MVGVLGMKVVAAEKLELPERWFYLSTNLLVPESVETAEKLFERAEKAGYTGVLITDSKFSNFVSEDPGYIANVERVKKAATKHHIEIIPAVFPLGWSNSLLSRDPNLAEGLPVKEALFVVKNGEARIEAEPAVSLKSGDFANLKAWGFYDPTVSYDAAEKAACLVGGTPHARVCQTVRVSPFREYRISVRVKTRDFKGDPTIAVLPKDQGKGPESLDYPQWGIPANSDWKTYTVVFNSLDQTEVTIYFGAWESKGGKAWLADAKIEEVGLLNVLRRAGTPLVVKREGGDILVEGKDFAEVKDPQMGQVPWPGEYITTHDGPAIKMLGNVADGTRLRVSWYHPMIVYGGSVMLCPSEPKTVQLLQEEAARVHKLFNAKAYFMAHDEIRVMNWCKACQDRKTTPGEMLADNLRMCIKTLKELNPGGKIYVWSDMFDPHHNARDRYYLVNGNLAKSWEGLDKDVIIALWNIDTRTESMAFFSKLGNPMLIAGYYDVNPDMMGQWLDAAVKSPGKIVGTMYTTWENKFEDLEAFAKVVERYRK